MTRRKIAEYALYGVVGTLGALAFYFTFPHLNSLERGLFVVSYAGCLIIGLLTQYLLLKLQSVIFVVVWFIGSTILLSILIYSLCLLLTPFTGIMLARVAGLLETGIYNLYILYSLLFMRVNDDLSSKQELAKLNERYATMLIRFFPNEALIYYVTRAQAYIQQNKIRDAIQDYDIASRLLMRDLLSAKNTAFTWSSPASERTLQTEEIAINHIASLYQHEPTSKTYALRHMLFIRNIRHYLPRHAQDAAYLCELMLRIPVRADHELSSQVTESNLRLDYAKWLFELKRYDEALTTFQHVLGITPDALDAALGSALAHYALGEREAAYAAWQTLSQRAPHILNADWVTTNFYVKSPFAMAEIAQHIIATLEQQTA